MRQLAAGTVFGRFVVLERVGAGAMGVVYAAYDPRLDRKIALKLLRAEASGEATAERRARLLREAQAMARLSHPNVLAVFDTGEHEGEIFLAMEFVAGTTLRGWLADRKRPWREALETFVAAGRGLQAAHAAGLVHRDFKPENVLVDRDGRVRVTDFGLARAAVSNLPLAPIPSVPPMVGELETLTHTGALVGTPGYMAPEQILGRGTDARTDQFAFCVALYEAIYGERPFAGETVEQLAFAVTEGRLRSPPQGVRVPIWLRRIIVRGLSRDPACRYPSMEALLAAVVRHDPIRLRRRWLVLGAALVAAGAVGVTLAAVRQHRGQLCAGGTRKLAGVWDRTRAQHVEKALLATERPFAAATARSVAEALDAYATSWIGEYREACEATRLRGEQSEKALDLRMACLDRRLWDVQALVELLTHADGKVAEKAVQATQRLRGPESCADVSVLAAVVEPPTDERGKARVDDLRKRFSELKAIRDAGRWAAALEGSREALATARALGHAPVLAEALSLVAELAGRRGDDHEAEGLLYEALATADAGRHDEERLNILNELIWCVGVSQGRIEEAERIVRQAESVASRIGPGHERARATLLAHRASILRAQGKNAAALASDRAALELLEKVLPPGHQNFAGLLNNMGSSLTQLGRLDEALDYLRRSLAQTELALGPTHPEISSALTNLGWVLQIMGRHREALATHERARAIKEATMGPDHVALDSTLCNLADLWRLLGELDEALVAARRALALREKAGADHIDMTDTLDVLAAVHRARGELAEAEAYYQRGLDLAERAGGPEHPQVALMLAGLGRCALDRRDPTAARARFRAALAVREKALGPGHFWVADDLAGMAQALFEMGRAREAIAPLERAWSLQEPARIDPGVKGRTAFLLARVLWETGGDQERAFGMATRARDELSKAEGVQRNLLPDVEHWLARRAARARSQRNFVRP